MRFWSKTNYFLTLIIVLRCHYYMFIFDNSSVCAWLLCWLISPIKISLNSRLNIYRLLSLFKGAQTQSLINRQLLLFLSNLVFPPGRNQVRFPIIGTFGSLLIPNRRRTMQLVFPLTLTSSPNFLLWLLFNKSRCFNIIYSIVINNLSNVITNIIYCS